MKTIAKAGIGLAAVAAIAATGALVAFAWGPSRPTYTLEKPADHIVFNSITNNNKEVGDERYFVSASPYTGSSSSNYWSDSTAVENGKEYVVRMYVHNNAAANLNLVAKNTRAFVVLPTTTGTEITVSGKISADNANPKTVWDETKFVSKNGEKFNLAYVPGTAKYYNTKDGKLRTYNLDTNLFTSTGSLLGYDKMDGNIPGCNAYSGYVTFHVKAQFAAKNELTISKEVKILGQDSWSEQVKATAGQTVRFRLHVKNTGNTQLKNVTVRDILPAGLTYVKGTTTVANSTNPKGIAVSDGIITNHGINIGTYNANGDAWIYFNATVDKAVSEKCENSILRNVAQTSAGTITGTKEDKADVIVEGKVCKDGFKVDKMVKLTTESTWHETVKAKAGETVDYRIQFKNTGDTTLKNVVLTDVLPKNMTYVKGSSKLDGKAVADSIVAATGINIGSVAAGKTATFTFQAKVDKSLEDACNSSTLTNTVKGKYNNDDKTSKSDTAVVTVDGKVCKDGFKVDKMVKLPSESEWHETIKAKASQTVDYRIRFTNTGDNTLKNVVLSDTLPAHMTYVKGSSKLDGKAVDDGVISKGGLNIGSVAAGKTVALTFQVKVNADLKDSCEDVTLTNTATGKYNNDDKTSKSDTAVVTIDGKVCEEEKPGFTINKMVQIKGGKTWAETVDAKAGEQVRYRIQFKNTGNTDLKNVVIRDNLPAGMTYVKGSTILYNSENKNGKTLGDGIISKSGINIGTVAKGSEATIYFYAKVNSSLKDNCEDSTLTNVVEGHYNGDYNTTKKDTAKVDVEGKECKDPTPPELPKTGAADIISGIVGLASVTTAAGYYIISRKK